MQCWSEIQKSTDVISRYDTLRQTQSEEYSTISWAFFLKFVNATNDNKNLGSVLV